MTKKLLVAFIFLSIFSLVSCSRDDEDESAEPVAIFDASGVEFDPDAFPRFIDMAEDGTTWVLASEADGYSVRMFEQDSLFSYPGSATLATGTLVMSIDGTHPISGFHVSGGHLTIIRAIASGLNITRTDKFGELLYEADLELHRDAGINVISSIVDSDGRLYIAWMFEGTFQTEIAVISAQGDISFSLSIRNNFVHGLALSEQNTPVALMDDASLWEIDTDNQAWGNIVNLTGTFVNITNDRDGIIYLSSTERLYRYNVQDNALERIFSYSEFDIWPLWVLPITGSEFLVGSFTGMHHIFADGYYMPPDPDAVSTITIALSEHTGRHITEAIREFNRENEEYRIEIREITEADIPRFLTELSVGQIPDIIYYREAWDILQLQVPARRLAARGMLADLYNFIDFDPELSRESFVPTLINAVSHEGSLYELPYSFWINIAVGEATRLGKEMGWTFGELLVLLEDINFEGYLLNKNTTQDSVLWSMLTFLMDDFVCWNTGAVSFESYEFIKLLEIVRRYAPAEIDRSGEPFYEWDEIAEGRQLMMHQRMSEPNFLQFLDYHFEEMVPIGFPASYGVGNAFNFEGSFAISSTSEYQDVAWSFIRQFYLPRFWEQNRLQIPVHVDALESWLSVTNNGWELGLGDAIITIGGNTAYDVERTRKILETTTRVYHIDRDIMAIVSEEAGRFFHGGRSAEDTARVIQSRVQTYVWEQSG